MGQTAAIFDAAGQREPQLAMAAVPHADPGTPASARLIPGAGNPLRTAEKNIPRRERLNRSWESVLPNIPAFVAGATVNLLPQFSRRFCPARLGVAVLDVAVITLVFLKSGFFASALRDSDTPPLNVITRVFFIVVFLLFAIQEGLYSKSRKTLWAQCGLGAKAILWTTLLTSLALKCSSSTVLRPLLFLAGVSVCVFCVTRRILMTVAGVDATGDLRNVLIVGSRISGQQIGDAIHDDFRSGRSVKGLIADHDFRDIHGPARLRTMAREECIDEVIIATHDSGVAEAAIREARHNRLDIGVVPQLFATQHGALELETLAGAPMVRIHQQLLPEWTLAVKRMADVALAGAGLVVLFPLLLLIAAVIKTDSPGPVFYRAVRVGRKKQKFVCFKFRSMVPEADAGKEKLRARNERDGAFFKIADDPRLTRAGRFLRRYSLDELPQLWNVLRGEMSLVGPRPHPLDDFERYDLGDLQRLGVPPGLTGLWQVTARRDPSFEHGLALDLEYIRTWTLWRDFQILYKTISVVLHGSGV